MLSLYLLHFLALISYRVFRYETTIVVKTIHVLLQIVAFIFAVVSLNAVFSFHNHQGVEHMTSLHSWIGMIIVVVFGAQVCKTCFYTIMLSY